MRNKRGFTILELLVVVAILAILAVIAVPQFIGAIDKSRDSQYLAELDSVSKAVSVYYMEHGLYPTLQGDQPTLGDPKNIRFSTDEEGNEGLCPNYLSSLPHFSYWYVDHEGAVYHTQYAIEDQVDKGDYEVSTHETGVELKIPYGVRNESRENYPAVSASFKGSSMHPESPEYSANQAPVPVIVMNPDSNIKTTTSISWSYTFTDKNGDTIINEEWGGDKRDIYDTEGSYTVKLRVQDSQGKWSEWVEKTFTVTKQYIYTVGQQVLMPEAGWARFDAIVGGAITYTGSWDDSAYNDSHVGNHYLIAYWAGSEAKFSFNGTRIRLICMVDKAMTFKVSIDGVEEIVSIGKGAVNRQLAYEKLGLSSGKHQVIITKETGGSYDNSINLDAIDIDDGGTIEQY